jgi:hypothetical protein
LPPEVTAPRPEKAVNRRKARPALGSLETQGLWR